jgi:hypothetical protein
VEDWPRERSAGASMKSHRKTRSNTSSKDKAKEIALLATRSSVDTIELFFPRPPAGLRTSLEAAVGKRIKIEDCFDKTDYYRGVRVILNRPNRLTLEIASHLLHANKSATLSREDIATDFETTSEEAAQLLLELLRRRLVLKWRSPTETKNAVGTTIYWTAGRPNRNLVVYEKADRTIRLELRFLSSRSVRRAGLANPTSLLELNPRKILERNIALVSFKDRFILKAVRKAVSADRQLHLKERQVRRRSPSAESFIDQYQSRIPIRAERIVRRIDMQELRSSTRANSTQRIPLGAFLKIPECFSWPE